MGLLDQEWGEGRKAYGQWASASSPMELIPFYCLHDLINMGKPESHRDSCSRNLTSESIKAQGQILLLLLSCALWLPDKMIYYFVGFLAVLQR